MPLLNSSSTSLPIMTSSLSLVGENFLSAIAPTIVRQQTGRVLSRRLLPARRLAPRKDYESTHVVSSRFPFLARRRAPYKSERWSGLFYSRYDHGCTETCGFRNSREPRADRCDRLATTHGTLIDTL